MNKKLTLAVAAALLLSAFQFFPVTNAASAVPGQAATVVLTIIPPKLPADGGVYPAAIVSLQDSANLPTAALGNVTVFLTSDQTNIVSVPASVTILAGQEYAIANVTTTSTPGSAMITASAQGLKSLPPSAISTVTPSGYPSKLLLFTSPDTFLPRADTGVVRVEVVDDAGLPSKAISSIPVQLSSSNASIALLSQSLLTIQTGNFFADGSFNTTNSGSAVITGASTGYKSGAALVTVNKPSACTSFCGPYKLSLRVVAGGSPGTLPTDGQNYNVLEVSIETSSGSPVTSASDTIVQLTSDQSEVASVPSLISIPAGSISYLTSVTTSALAGVANVTATAPSANLLPGTVSIKTVVPAPSKLQAYVAPPSSAYSTHGSYPILVLQLQDSSGNPARARQDTSITVTSSNSSLLSRITILQISKGSDYVFSFLHTEGVGKSVLTSTSPDLSSSQADLTSVPSPLAVSLLLTSTSAGFIYENQTATFEFTASFVGRPLQNVNVSWSATSGHLAPLSGNTGTSGTAFTVLSPASYGAYNITASANSPQTGPLLLVYHLTVAQVPQKPAPSLVQQILGYWYYIVAAVAVVIVALVYLLRMRRKKQRAEIEAGFEVV